MSLSGDPWHAAYPSPRNAAPTTITRAEVLRKLQVVKDCPDFLLIDLRRNDHTGGTIRGSLNLPAQSLYHSLSTLYSLCEAGNIKNIIWYCGSSKGRGTRAAGWFDDLIQDKENHTMKSLILLGGISGWVLGGGEFLEMMDGFDKSVWEKS